MTVVLIVRLKGHAGAGDTLRRLLGPMSADNDIPGCLGWDVFASTTDPDEILLLERWESVEAHKAYLEKAAASGEMESIFAHVRDVERRYYQAL